MQPMPATPDEPVLRELAGRAVALAAEWVQAGRRIDMQQLAGELGVSRVTLFRHVGGRDELLGRSLWVLAERSLAAAERRFDLGGVPGSRAAGVLRLFNGIIAAAPGLRVLLDREPALALRVLTDPRGLVQPRTVQAIEGWLRRDERESGLVPIVEPHALAFALVRLGEAFLYADVLASLPPDVDLANRLQGALIEYHPAQPDPAVP